MGITTFMAMFRYILLVLVVMAGQANGQVRLKKLTLGHKEKFVLLRSDTLVVDTLIMKDSSQIILNSMRANNFIHAKYLLAGNGCKIIGRGKNGNAGQPGTAGTTTGGPCYDGTPGANGTPGTRGNPGVNLFMVLTDLRIEGKLIIDLSGGEGGDGGDGGDGGGGSPGTRLCKGGNGGKGGEGGNGGNGGNSGNLSIVCRQIYDIRNWVGNLIVLRLYGGNQGVYGNGGYGGFAGLNPAGNNNMDGDRGSKGKDGNPGTSGQNGGISFSDK